MMTFKYLGRKIASKIFTRDLYQDQSKAITIIMFKHKKLLLGLTTGSGKSKWFKVAGVMLDGITLVIVPLLALSADQVQKHNGNQCVKINLDKVNESKEKSSKLKEYFYRYDTKQNKVQFFSLPHHKHWMTGNSIWMTWWLEIYCN